MKINKGFQLRDICGEKVIIAEGLENMNFSKLISLNESAAYIWEAISKMQSFDANTMEKLLLDEYDVKEDEAFTDANNLLTEWKAQGLIED